MNRKDRRAARARGETEAATADLPKIAGQFIDLANRQNRTVDAPRVFHALLWSAARYGAFVGKSIVRVADHEAYVAEMTKQFQEMLREHLADPSLDPPA